MKTMIKSLLLVAVFACLSSARADSYLYWMVGSAGPYADASYAKIAYTTDDGTTSTYLYNGNPGAEASQDKFYNFFSDQYALLGSLELGTSYKFFVELYNSGNTKLGASEMLAYDTIKNAIGPDAFSITDQAVFNVPEPTSGMLALLGFGLMALRRKQKKA